MITAQIESFELAIPELERIFPEHHRELGLFRDVMPLAPRFPEYVLKERLGEFFLATVRWDGKIAAYYTCLISPGLHYRTTLSAHMDMLYVIPEYRERGLIVPLMRCVEKELKRRGVKIWYCGYKTLKPFALDRLYRNLGFSPSDTYVAKWLGAE